MSSGEVTPKDLNYSHDSEQRAKALLFAKQLLAHDGHRVVAADLIAVAAYIYKGAGEPR